MKRLKTLPFGAGRDVSREFQNRLTKRRINLLAAIFLPRRTPCCLLRFSRWHNARVILTLPLSEMYATVGSAIACDHLRLYGNNSPCDRLRSEICDPRSAIVCVRLRSYGNQPLIGSLRELSRVSCVSANSVSTNDVTFFMHVASRWSSVT